MRIWFDGEADSGAVGGGADASGGGIVAGGATRVAEGIPDDFDFSTVLPDDLKGNTSLAKFSAHKGKAWAENVARSLVSAQGMIGADPNELVRVPKDASKITAEDRGKFLERLGLPKDEKAYALKGPEKPLAGFEPDGELGKWFSKEAQAQGLFPDQAQNLYSKYVELNREAMVKQQNMFAAMDKKNVDDLQKEFGKAFDGELKAAQFGASKLGGDEFVKRIGDMGLGTDPVFVKAMAKYGRAMAEGSSGGDKGDVFNSGQSPAALHAEATAILRQAMEVMDSNPGKAKELNMKAQEIFARAAS